MRLLRYAALAMLVLALACKDKGASAPAASADSTSTVVAGFDWNGTLGVALAQGDTLCLRVPRADLSPGTPVLLILASQSQSATAATVVRPLPSCGGPALATVSYYQLERQGALEYGGGAHIAVIGAIAGADDRPVEIDLDLDGMPERFRECTSLEGLHLTVWTGEPLTGMRRWHYYHYLGYDVDASCAPADYEPDRSTSG